MGKEFLFTTPSWRGISEMESCLFFFLSCQCNFQFQEGKVGTHEY